MFAELFAFVMAYVGEGDATFGTLEIVVFKVASEVDVGLLADGIADKEAASTTADGHTAYDRGGDVADAEQGKAKGGFDLFEKGGGGQGVGE